MYVEPPCLSINKAHQLNPSSSVYVYHYAGPAVSRLPSDTVLYIRTQAYVSITAIIESVSE